MRQALILFLILSPLTLMTASCSFPNKMTDLVAVKYLRNNEAQVKEAASFSVAATYDSDLRSFPVSGIKDSIMRKKINSLGKEVFVKYSATDPVNDIPDSTVTFFTTGDWGTIEILYDFATTERNMPELIANKKQWYITKVADRIYYKRNL